MSEEEEEKTPPLGYVLIDQLDCTHLYISLEQNIEVSWLRDDDDDDDEMVQCKRSR